MNKAKLKAYAPQARKDFIAAVTTRANQLGLSDKGGKLEVAPAEKSGDVVIIAGQPWPAKVQGQREQLIKRIQKDGFAQTMEAIAYTWFNRFAALRFMEIHDYLSHGHRALSSREGGLPEILTHAAELAQGGEIPGLNSAQVTELKLVGNKDGELYKILLVAQCNALSRAMPFLFEHIDDETELLLPDNLLRTDSIITKLVDAIPEGDWQPVEIIGWLYQFYISEKKDEVIGKVVKSEDIPAATQLFTPNWIVQYLVQNSVGRLWMMANPASTLKSQWPYYIEPAEQTPEVQAQLDAVIQTRMDEDGGSLNPETITVLDPACGSGHILVEAYEVLKGIYLERGYRLRDIPRLILEKNLYGLDIDDRAAQMAGFALLMKARADDRRLLNEPPRLNVLSLQESKGLDLDELATQLTPFGIRREALKALLDTFAHAKTFGSLIQIPKELNAELPTITDYLQLAFDKRDLYVRTAAQDLMPLVRQARYLASEFDTVVANPPYMGGKYFNSALKEHARLFFPDSKSDLFAMFIDRGFKWCKPSAFNSMITMQTWMFLSSYESLRESLLSKYTITNLAHFPYEGKSPTVMGISFGVAASVFLKNNITGYSANFSCTRHFELKDDGTPIEFPTNNERRRSVKAAEFAEIPGAPISYWVTEAAARSFSLPKVGETLDVVAGLTTGNTNRFLRYWYEIDYSTIEFNLERFSEPVGEAAYIPYNKGGDFRKWFGNAEYVLRFSRSAFQEMRKCEGYRGDGLNLFFNPGITWAKISSGRFSARFTPGGFGFDATSTSAFGAENDLKYITTCLNSVVGNYLLNILNSSMVYLPRDIKNFPIPKRPAGVEFDAAFVLAKQDWDAFETSWGFQKPNWKSLSSGSVRKCWVLWEAMLLERRSQMRNIEEKNNRLLIEAYGLQAELSPEILEDHITLARADREKDCQRLISYAIGCMMGRYSHDEPGLIYAHAGNVGFDATRYKNFPADADGIVPLTDELWFEDDAANRVREFLLAVWGAERLDENRAWLAESLGKKASETPEETIRRYLADKFFKDHLQTYKKRPIYWLFSSGKQGTFQALVYLHRYHEGTLARMRAEYVVPLTGKIQSRIDMLEKDAAAATSAAARNRINKEIEGLRKKHVELLAYDEKLRHYADMRIKLDLDDGVKVNYGKFGDLLAEVKAVTGGGGDD